MSRLRSLVLTLRDRPIPFRVARFLILGGQVTAAPRWHARLPLRTTPVASPADPLLARLPAPRRRFAQRMMARYGDIGLLTFTADDDLAGWLWLSRAAECRDPVGGMRWRLAPGELFLYDIVALPPYRDHLGVGTHIAVRSMAFAHEVLGAERWYTAIHPDNTASLRLCRSFGGEVVQQIRVAQLLEQRAVQLPLTDRPAYGPCSRDGRHHASASRRRVQMATVTAAPRDA